MLYAMLAACATLIFVLALADPRAAEARLPARLFRAQQKWAEMMDRQGCRRRGPGGRPRPGADGSVIARPSRRGP
jgi:hypothetical protein